MEFKVGDKVLVKTRYSEYISEVSKITPTGRIKVEDSYYDSRGHQIGGDIWGRKSVTLATDEIIEDITKKSFVKNVIRRMREIETLEYEDALKISDILKEYN